MKQCANIKQTAIKNLLTFYPPLLLNLALILTSCSENIKSDSGFTYNPSVPYPTLNPGDFWPDKFDQRGLKNACIHKDKLYCNTIDVRGDSNFLYCLNPNDGRVVWRAHVAAYATQPVSYSEDTVFYCSYLGNMYVYSSEGTELWNNKFFRPYGGHWLDTTSSKLYLRTPVGPVYIYDLSYGKLISEIDNDSLSDKIEKYRDNMSPINKEYKFEKNGWIYLIIAKNDKDMGKALKINIKKTKVTETL